LVREAETAVQRISLLARSSAATIPAIEEDAISRGSEAAASEADSFARAYKALRDNDSIQVNLTPPPQPPKPPAWLRAFLDWLGDLLEPVGRFLKWLGSLFPDAAYAKFFLWAVIVVAAVMLSLALYNRIRHGTWRLRLPRAALAQDPSAEEEWLPDESGARSWLDEADALAREGRFAEAIHHLLFRSIDDIANRRPGLIRPALTSRELAQSQSMPGRARELFAAIARLVERSLFGGRPVDEADWSKARQAYSDFALPSAWRA
jgi:Domain of unknown function (DUF4129)